MHINECRKLKELSYKALCNMASSHCTQEEGEEECSNGGEQFQCKKKSNGRKLCTHGSDIGRC